MKINLRYPIDLSSINGLRVEIYKNLHTDMWSCRALQGDFKNKVIFHVDEIILENSTCHVSKKLQAKVRKAKQKRVHAVLRGYIKTIDKDTYIKTADEIYYNPYLTDTFINKRTEKELNQCGTVLFNVEGRVFFLETR